MAGRSNGLALEPAIRTTGAVVENLAYDSHTRLFQFDLVAKPSTSPVVTLRAHPKSLVKSERRSQKSRLSRIERHLA
jgi:hypothetical protein